MFAFPILPKNGFGCFGMGGDGSEGWFDGRMMMGG